MARGLIVGRVVDKRVRPKARMEVVMLALTGDSEVNGNHITFSMPPLTTKSYTLFDTRLSDSAGFFALPFTWMESNVSQGLGVAISSIDIRVKVAVYTPPGDNDQTSVLGWGRATLVLDVPKLVDNIKYARKLEGGDEAVLKEVRGELKKAVKGDEFKSMHVNMFSSEQHAIVGFVPPITFPK